MSARVGIRPLLAGCARRAVAAAYRAAPDGLKIHFQSQAVVTGEAPDGPRSSIVLREVEEPTKPSAKAEAEMARALEIDEFLIEIIETAPDKQADLLCDGRSKSTISRRIKALKEDGLIDDKLRLTEAGWAHAEELRTGVIDTRATATE